MKRLSNYLNEQLLRNIFNEAEDVIDKQVIRLNNVIASYIAKTNPIIIKVPSSYSEDDLMVYLDDVCLERMPASVENTDNLFGANKENITDAYFAYDRYEVVKDGVSYISINWDPKYDTKNVSSDESFVYYKLYDFKYIITFSYFNLVDVPESERGEYLYTILKRTESNEVNTYPIEIEIKRDNIKYE